MMTRMLKDKIGYTMEVYTNDMVVKSRWEAQYIGDLREVFEVLR